MGYNSIHSAPEDFITGINKSNGTHFKCQCITENFQYMQVVQNIDSSVIQCVLVINGHCNINVGDLVQIPLYDDVLKVENTSAERNQKLFRRRNDIAAFTGKLQVALS